MSQAIDLLKTTRPTFYRWLRAGKIRGMKVGRQWRFRREDIDRFLSGKEPTIELPTDIGPLVATLTGRVEKLGKAPAPDPEASPVKQAVNLMVLLGVRTRASDIHLEPYEKKAVLRIRVDGVLDPVAEFDIRLLPAIVERFKWMAACDVREKVLPQDGRILIKLKDDQGPVEMDLRVSFLPALTGEAVTVRILRPDQIVLDLDRLGYSPADRERLLRGIEAPAGVVVITGPTGCGKTTVLYCCLTHLITPAVKVMSVEDPVEYFIPGVVQVPVRAAEGVTFERVVRSFLRSDPDVMLVGEIRDREALNVCLQAALAGHMVLTTLHTEDAATTLRRMVEIGAPAFVIADATNLISSQRLVRCLCKHCSEPAEPPAEKLARAEALARKGGLDWDALAEAFRRPVGCPKCALGYRGRTLICEMLEVTSEIGQALRGGASSDEVRGIAIGQGMTTMAADGIRRAAAGQTTLDEIFRVHSLR